jgi:hypothetical protein
MATPPEKSANTIPVIQNSTISSSLGGGSILYGPSGQKLLATPPAPGLRVARCAASLIPIVGRAEHWSLVRSSSVRRIPEIPRIA